MSNIQGVASLQREACFTKGLWSVALFPGFAAQWQWITY